jgi:hypothetical protein
MMAAGNTALDIRVDTRLVAVAEPATEVGAAVITKDCLGFL